MKLRDYFQSLQRFGVAPILGYAGLKSAGLTAPQCLNDSKLHAQLILNNSLKFEPDAVYALMDLTVEAESYGVRPMLKDYDPPEIRTHLSIEDATNRPGTGLTSRMSSMLDTAKEVSQKLDVPVGFFLTGPFTMAGQIVGVQQLLLGMMRTPKKIEKLIERCTAIIVDYAKLYDETEIDFLIMADMSSSLISPKQFEQFGKPPITRVVKSVSKDIVLHICGRANHLIKQMSETGVAGISIDQNVSLPDVVRAIPSDVLILGNYSPTDLSVEKPETIRANVTKMLTAVVEADNVVASTGCDVPSTTPVENIQTFVQAVKSHKI